MMNYNPADWYWVVGGSTSMVYCSARASFVAISDATYVAWLNAGNKPTAIDTNASLYNVLAQQHPAGISNAIMTAGQQAAAAGLQAQVAGIILTSTGTPSLNGTYAIGSESLANVTGVIAYILVNNTFPGPSATMPWSDAEGGVHIFPNVTTFKHFATAFADYVAAVALYAQTGGQVGSLPSNAITIP